MSTKKTMNPNRFVVGERVRYENHVTGNDIAMLEVTRVDGDFVFAAHFFNKTKEYKFKENGDATWSSNLRISHLDLP